MSARPRDRQPRHGRDRAWYRRLADEAGALTVEFALVAPLLLGLLFGTMEIGRLMFTQAVLYFAVQETTRFAAVNGPTGDPPDYTAYEAQLKQEALDNVIIIDSSGVVPVTTAAAAAGGSETTIVTIQMNYTFTWMLPYVGTLTGPISLGARSDNLYVENAG